MAPHVWHSLGLLTLTALQLTSAQQFVSDNLLTSGGESVCQSRSGGYYADLASDCRSYTLCGPGGREFDFSCPPGTRFHQQFLVCDHTYQVDCPESPRYYARNELIGRVEQGSELASQQKRLTPARSSRVVSQAPRPQIKPRPQFRPPSAPAFNESAPRRLQPRRPSVSPPPARPTLPTANVGQTLLDLVQLSTRESSRRPPGSGSQQRPRVPGSESRGRQVSPAVTSILTQVAALGRPGRRQVAALDRTAARRLREPTTRGTFFPARPERPRPGAGRLERLNKSLSSPRSANEAVRPRASVRKVRFPARKTRPEAPLRSGASRRQVARSVVGGWRPVSRRAPGSDPRCPRCLAALITDWDDCFPCVSVLR